MSPARDQACDERAVLGHLPDTALPVWHTRAGDVRTAGYAALEVRVGSVDAAVDDGDCDARALGVLPRLRDAVVLEPVLALPDFPAVCACTVNRPDDGSRQTQ